MLDTKDDESLSLGCTKSGEPFLRWAGSKRKLLPILTQYWNGEYKRYIEPFAGSACLFFAIAPPSAVLGDLNRDLIGTYKQIKSRAREVSAWLRKFRRGADEYYRVRSIDPTQLEPCEKAARFIFLNRFCFNGIYRTNLSGKFNVPYSATKTGNLPTLHDLLTCSGTLSRAKLIAGDFEKCLANVREGDFVYLDPPYAVAARRVFCEYGPKPFDNNDLERLTSSLETIHKSGAHFVVSYAYSSEGLKTFKRWRLRKIRTVRNMAGFASPRKFAFEILATNIKD